MATALKEVKLRFSEGENEGIEIRLEVPREVIIGRGEDCDIYLGEKKISRRHAKLITSEQGLVVEDMNSTNGTFVNGKRIHKEKLTTEDALRIGTSVMQIDFIYEEPGSAQKAPTKAQESPPNIPTPLQQPAKRAPVEISEPVQKMAPQVMPSSLDQEISSIEIELEDEISVADAKPVRSTPPSVPAAPLPAPDASPKPGGTKGLSGQLSAMPLADLLQTFHNGSKSGILKIAGPTKGQIYLQQGSIKYACLEMGITGEKAITRMLAWKDGEFELVQLPDPFTPSRALGSELNSSTENMLMEGFRQIDELNNLRKSLPAEHTVFTLNGTTESPLSRLHPRVLDVLQIVIKHARMDRILDASPFSDLDTAKMIFYLLKKNYIQAS